MRIRQRVEIFFQPASPFGDIHRGQAFRERSCRGHFAQGQGLIPLEQWFDGAAQVCPILDLSGDGSFGDLAGQTGIENQDVRKLYRLTHRGYGSILPPIVKPL